MTAKMTAKQLAEWCRTPNTKNLVLLRIETPEAASLDDKWLGLEVREFLPALLDQLAEPAEPTIEVDCPRARSEMTPCVARDGHTACRNDGRCVGCGEHPADLLTDLVPRYIAAKNKP